MRTKASHFFQLLAVSAFLAMGSNQASAAISIETVAVGDIGNLADMRTYYGSVGYSYNIGKYEVTIGQYTAFLNAVAATDTYGLYNTSMGIDSYVAGISRAGVSGNYSYSVMTNHGQDMTNRPITYVSWFDAARFSNWMANGQTTGAQAANTTENGAYTLNGATSGNLTITKNTTNPNNGQAVNWWIPSDNEWYKAAYYDPTKGGTNYWQYPTQSDSAPGNVIGSGANQANLLSDTYTYSTGTAPYITNGGAFSASASHYGTYDQGGNVWEWDDGTSSDLYRRLRGGSWNYTTAYMHSSWLDVKSPNYENYHVGFRVASSPDAVPEPSTIGFMLLSGAGWLVWKRRKISS